MKYFVSGHRDLTREEFDKHYIPQIIKVITHDITASFVVGDWEGCDSMFLRYMIDNRYINDIHLYCVRESKLCNNLELGEDYAIRLVSKRNYDECDISMTRDSDFDIAWIRPGREDSHTAKNIKRRYGF